MTENYSNVLRESEAAEYIGVSVPTMRVLRKKGLVRYSQRAPRCVIQYKREWLDEYLLKTSRAPHYLLTSEIRNAVKPTGIKSAGRPLKSMSRKKFK